MGNGKSPFPAYCRGCLIVSCDADCFRHLVGLPLATPFESIYTGGRARRNCTHLFDLAALAIAQAARGTAARRYEAIVPDPGDAPVTIEVRRDGQLVHSWSAQAGQIVAPAEFAGRTLRQGFAAWASGAFAGDEFEAALVLARTVFVSYGRRWNMAAWAGLTARRTSRDTDLCYAYSKQRADTTVFLGTNVRDEGGAILVDGAADQGYRGLIEEETKPWTYMKFPHLRALGREAGWYRVGPLARVQNCDFIATPRAEAARREFVAWGDGAPVHATLAYHWARMIEVLHCAEVIAELLADPEILAGELTSTGTRTGHGVGIIEAPRGTLIHDYDVGEDDLVTRCNLIVSTTHNNQAMNEAVRQVARQYLDGQEITEGLLNRIEVAIRAYDPCLSCATHALGRMPLDVTLLDAEGGVLDQVLKSADGSLLRA